MSVDHPAEAELAQRRAAFLQTLGSQIDGVTVPAHVQSIGSTWATFDCALDECSAAEALAMTRAALGSLQAIIGQNDHEGLGIFERDLSYQTSIVQLAGKPKTPLPKPPRYRSSQSYVGAESENRR